jgi:hypothetical protein
LPSVGVAPQASFICSTPANFHSENTQCAVEQ